MYPTRCTLLLGTYISTSVHVSGNCVPIIRRTYCTCATLVFFTVYGWLSGYAGWDETVWSAGWDGTVWSAGGDGTVWSAGGWGRSGLLVALGLSGLLVGIGLSGLLFGMGLSGLLVGMRLSGLLVGMRLYGLLVGMRLIPTSRPRLPPLHGEIYQCRTDRIQQVFLMTGTQLPETCTEVEINIPRSSVHLVGFIRNRLYRGARSTIT
jgi:hypothetical protein